jgi:putative hydrolase of the HAD superfamily
MDAVMARWHEAMERLFERYLAGEIGFHEQRMERIRSFFDAQFTDEEADARFSIYLDAYERNWRLFLDAIPCLEALRGLRLGIISNGDGAQQNSKVQRLGLAPRLGTVVVSGDVGIRKPSQGIYFLACSRLGVKPQETAFVGDRLRDDAEGALEAGLHAFWLDRKGTGKTVPAGIRIIHSLAELPRCVL